MSHVERIDDRELLEQVLSRAPVCRLGLLDGDVPYIVPMNFVYEDSCFYLHSRKSGKKIDLLNKNNKVCIEIELVGDLITGDTPCEYGYSFKSVIAAGTAEILEEQEEKQAALSKITQKYTDSGWNFNDSDLDSVAVIRITVDTISCKQSLP
jgi:uncharacterized protein